MKTAEQWIMEMSYHKYYKVPISRLLFDIVSIQNDALGIEQFLTLRREPPKNKRKK